VAEVAKLVEAGTAEAANVVDKQADSEAPHPYTLQDTSTLKAQSALVYRLVATLFGNQRLPRQCIANQIVCLAHVRIELHYLKPLHVKVDFDILARACTSWIIGATNCKWRKRGR
jgi:hypothetical protein